MGDRKDYKFDAKVECASHSLRMTNCPWLGRGQVMWPITKFWGSNYITRTAELKVVKFCTRVGLGNINSMQQYDISPTKGRCYSHVTVLKFCGSRDAARRAGLSATAELLVCAGSMPG